GDFSAVLSSGVMTKSLVSLSQGGDVSSDTRSLRFTALNPWFPRDPEFPGPFDVRMNDQALPLAVLSQSGGLVNFGCDVTAFAGQNVTLQIGVVANPNDSGSEAF